MDHLGPWNVHAIETAGFRRHQATLWQPPAWIIVNLCIEKVGTHGRQFLIWLDRILEPELLVLLRQCAAIKRDAITLGRGLSSE